MGDRSQKPTFHFNKPGLGKTTIIFEEHILYFHNLRLYTESNWDFSRLVSLIQFLMFIDIDYIDTELP